MKDLIQILVSTVKGIEYLFIDVTSGFPLSSWNLSYLGKVFTRVNFKTDTDNNNSST